MYRRVLSATDLSEPSLLALREADAIARESGGALAVCHVIPTIFDAHTLLPQDREQTLVRIAELEVQARQLIEQEISRSLGRSDVEIFIERGNAYAEVVRRAETWGADLVVVGSHGRTGLSRVVLGSVAEKILRYAHSPVLVAREAKKSGVVLAATDLSDPSLPAVAASAEEARRRGAKLTVLFVVDLTAAAFAAAAGGLFGAIGALPPAALQRETQEALQKTLESALERFGATGEPLVRQGAPASVITETAEELGAELLVIGTHGRTGVARVALGSVAERVVRTAGCPVLAVRLTTPT